MWQGLQEITDYKKKTSHVMDTDVTLPDKLNTFFADFEDNTGRPQVVKVGRNISTSLTLNTGESPLLYSLFIHNCVAMHASNSIIKFADVTTVVGLITNNHEKSYREEVGALGPARQVPVPHQKCPAHSWSQGPSLWSASCGWSHASKRGLIFSFPPSDNQVVNRISACLADISVWMTDHHLKLNLGKTELLFLPGKDCPFHDLAITVDNSIVSSSQSAKNLGVILDNTLSFSTNIKAVTRSCRFMLYNIRRVRPCLTQEAAQVLIQALVISRLDYCNSLLSGLPACAIKPLQLIQNAAARLVFNFPKFSHVTPLLRSLHWLPVEARIRYKTMVLAYGAVRGTAPPYLQALIRPYTQTRALRSSTSGLLASLPLRKYSSRSAQSKLFAALAPQWWNKLPHDARSAESITTFRRHLKPHLFKEYLG
ncbi:uncharacterized protein [Salvelinus alpinus]|uniref:uncharacterized protein n=1 Tax=Salvelinus alpinus TaxID=8036 RepID=UPI0039FDD3CB